MQVLGQAHRPLARGLPVGRAILDRQTVHIHDLAAAVETEFPDAAPSAAGWRPEHAYNTIAPRGVADRSYRDSSYGGSSLLGKANRSPENLRGPSRDSHRERALIQGIRERNAELREALEHQTATAEVLSIISRSPTDVQPVLDAIVESAARVCGVDNMTLRLREGSIMVSRAHFGPCPLPLAVSRSVLMRHSFAGSATMARCTFQTPVSRTNSLCSVRRVRHALFCRSPSSAGRIHRIVERASHRGARIHAAANQTTGNLRRSSCYRHRECAVIPMNSRNRWNSRLRPVRSWVSLPARRQICNQSRYCFAKRGTCLRCGRRAIWRLDDDDP